MEIKLKDENAKVRVEDLDGNVLISDKVGVLTGEIEIPNGENKTVKVIVTSENGEEKEYTLVIERMKDKNSYITGKITTENVNGEYISEVRIYREVEKTVTSVDEETGDEVTETITELEYVTGVYTEKDGTFKILVYNPDEDDIELLKSKYTAVISKAGYLDYTVEEIELKEEDISDIGEYDLIAGDIVETGEIEIDDLVQMNNHYGISIDVSEDGGSNANAKYDLNEDGIVDRLDRSILIKNYSKLAETVKWQPIEQYKQNAKKVE